MVARRVFLLLCLVAFCGFVCAERPTDLPHLKELHADSYDAYLKENPSVLGIFIAPWCKDYCDQLLLDANSAAAKLGEAGVKVVVVDQGQNEDFVKDVLGIEGFPAVSIISNGERSMYRGPRTAAGFAWYFNYYFKPHPLRVSTKSEVEAILADESTLHVAVGVFASAESAQYKAFANWAETNKDDFISAVFVGADKYALFNVEVDSLIMLQSWSATGAAPVSAAAPETEKAVTDWFASRAYPEIAEFGPVWAKFMNRRDLPVAKFIFNYTDANALNALNKGENVYIDIIREVAPLFEGKVVLAVQSKSKMEGVFEKTGNMDKDALIVASKFGTKGMYVYEWDFDVPTVSAWLDDYSNNKLRQWRKSEPVPETQPDNVVQVVGKTFDQIVLNAKKDVLIEFYAPWCGHCKKLIPIYEELATEFKDIDSVVIAKMDGTANEWDKEVFPLTGYPTIYFVPGGSKTTSPIKYQYARDVATLKKFIKHYAGIKYELPEDKKTEESDSKTKAGEQQQKQEL